MYYFRLENVRTGKREGLLIDEFTLENTKIYSVVDAASRQDIFILNFEDENYILDLASHRFIKEFKRKK